MRRQHELTLLRVTLIVFSVYYRGALKMTDMKMTDQIAGHENAGHEIARHDKN